MTRDCELIRHRGRIKVFVNFGSGTLVVLHGVEQVLSLAEAEEIMASARTMESK